MSLINKLKQFANINNYNWVSIERFNESWRDRIKFMAQFIEDNDCSVTDMGCGPMWLKNEISVDIKYTGVDYKDRGVGTIICDFNLYQFPHITTDVFFVSGCMEYIVNWKWFIKEISNHGRKCIISYCCLENVKNIKTRKKNAWVNSISTNEIIEEFNKNNMKLIKVENFDSNNTVFIFSHD